MANSNETTQQVVDPKYVEQIIKRDDFEVQFKYELKTVKHFSGYVSHINIPTAFLSNNKQVIKLQGKPFAKFMTYMGLGKRRFMRLIKDKGLDHAKNWMFEQYPKITTKEFKILFVGDRVARITSGEYIGIPHSVVQEVIEKRLQQEGINFEKTIRFGGINGAYKLLDAKLSEGEFSKQISYFNRNSGDHSLKFFGGGEVLVCTNGMISGQITSEMRVVHKLATGVVQRRIEKEIGAILEKLDFFPEQVLKLRKMQITKDEAKKKIFSLPIAKYLQEAIWTRLFQASKLTRNGQMDWDETVYGLYMASTFVASHNENIKKSKNIDVAINEDHVQKLQSLELFTTDWDAREKELEKTNAPKIEVKGADQ